jgi:methyl-accepting chemotaxis protein
MNNMKMKTRLTVGFLLIDVLLLFCFFCGTTTASRILQVQDTSRYLHNYTIFNIVLFIVASIIMAVVWFSLVNTLNGSLNQLITAAKQLSIGKVDVDLNLKSNDEFATLVTEVEKLVKNIHDQAEIVTAIADGDLTVTVTPKSPEDLMGNSLKKLLDQNIMAITNISEAAMQVKNSSAEVASASEALAQGSTDQASAIQEITASIEEIAVKTNNNATEAENAAKLMVDAYQAVDTGNQRMQETVQAMTDINESSESISKIIKVIDDIAFQTNILALNAAVEAARAGDAGKGFAVVAEEVRNLAAKCSAAAAETAEMIEDSIGKVEKGSGLVEESAQALEQITSSVQEGEGIVRGIADASNYQATAIKQINIAIEQVSQVVQNNSATSEECAASSVEMANQADHMSDMLSIFNLGRQSWSAGSHSSYRSYARSTDRNDQMSLQDGFGKY